MAKKKRINKKMLAILSLAGMAVVVVGVIVAINYRYRDPLPFMAEGDRLTAEAEQTEAQNVASVSGIADPEERFNRLAELNGEAETEADGETVAELRAAAVQAYGRAYSYARGRRALRKEAYTKLADLSLQMKDYNNARAIWNKQFEQDATNYDAKRKFADFYYELAQHGGDDTWSEVLKQSEYLVELREEDVYGYVMKAHAQAMLGISEATTDPEVMRAEAEELLVKVLELDASNIMAYRLLSQLAFFKSQHAAEASDRSRYRQEAENYLREAISKNAEDVKAYENLFDFWLYPELLEKYRAVTRGATEAERKDLAGERDAFEAKCIAEVSEISGRFPESGKLLTARAQLEQVQWDRLRERANIDAVIDLYCKAIEQDSENAGWYLTLARMYRHRSEYYDTFPEDWEQAFTLVRKALYLPLVNDLAGPRQIYARRTRFELMDMMIEMGANLAQASEEEAKKKWYLEKCQGVLSELRDAFGEENEYIWIARGSLALAEGRREEGVRDLYKADRSLDAGGRPNHRVKMRLYRALRNTEFHSLAVNYLAGAVRAGRHHAGIYEEYMDSLLAMPGRRSKQTALDLSRSYEETFGFGSRRDEIMTIRAQAHLSLGRQSSALKALSEVKGDSLKIRLLRAQTEEDAEKRVAALRAILADDPGNAGVAVAVVSYYMMAGREDSSHYESAREVIEGALKAAPENTVFLQWQSLLSEPDPGKVSDDRRREITLSVLKQVRDPFDRAMGLGGYYQQAAVRSESEDDSESARAAWEKARQHYEEARQDKPDDKGALNNSFRVAVITQDWPGAEQLLKTASTIDAVESLMYEADLAMAREQFSEAADRLERYLEERPVSIRAHQNLARMYALLNRHEEAIEEVRLAISQDQSNIASNRLLMSLLHERNEQAGLDKLSDSQIKEVIVPLEVILDVDMTDVQACRLRVVYYPLLISHLQQQYRQSDSLSEAQKEALLTTIEEGYVITVRTCRYLISQSPSDAVNWQMLAATTYQYAQGMANEQDKAKLLQEVSQTYEEGLQASPESTDLKMAYGAFLRNTGQGAKAEELMASMLAGSDGVGQEEAKLRLSGQLIAEGDYDRAKELLEEVLSEDAANRDARMRLADIYFREENYEESLKVYEQLEQEASEAILLGRMTECFLRLGRFEDAKLLLGRLEEQYPDSKALPLLLGQLEIRQTNYVAAVAYADQALAQAPKNRYAQLMKAEALLYSGEVGAARECLEELRRWEGGQGNLGRILLAQVHWASGRQDEAINELQAALQTDSGLFQARQMLVRILHGQRRWDDLEQLYVNTIKIYPRSVVLYLEAGEMFMQRAGTLRQRSQMSREYSKALSMFRQAWRLSKDYGEERRGLREQVLVSFVGAMVKVGQHDEALQLIDQYGTEGGAQLRLSLYKAEVFYRTKRKSEALSLFEKALEQAAENAQVRYLWELGWVYRASLITLSQVLSCCSKNPSNLATVSP